MPVNDGPTNDLVCGKCGEVGVIHHYDCTKRAELLRRGGGKIDRVREWAKDGGLEVDQVRLRFPSRDRMGGMRYCSFPGRLGLVALRYGVRMEKRLMKLGFS